MHKTRNGQRAPESSSIDQLSKQLDQFRLAVMNSLQELGLSFDASAFIVGAGCEAMLQTFDDVIRSQEEEDRAAAMRRIRRETFDAD